MNTNAHNTQTEIKTPRSSAGLLDARADGGQRDVTLTRHAVTIRRRIAGMGMKIDVPTRAYRGVVLSLEESARGRLHYRVTLRHADPDLSVILTEAFDESEILKDWRDWASFLTQSPLVERDTGALVGADDVEGDAPAADQFTGSFQRRRGAPASARSRGRFVRRRHVGGPIGEALHAGERKIVCYE
jgi:hypothetical protein